MSNLLIIFGSKSVEHEISIITTYQIKDYLKNYNIYMLYISKDKGLYLINNKTKLDDFKDINKIIKKSKKVKFVNKGIKKGLKKIYIDMALLCLHGTYGEDGIIPSILDFYDIYYTSSKFNNLAVCHDKVYFKDILKANNIKTLDYTYLLENEEYNNEIKYPIIIKPSSLGSSIGIKIINDLKEFDYKEIFKYDKKVLIEPFLINFKEYNMAIRRINNNIDYSLIEEVIKSDKILSYNNKYLNNNQESKRILPAKINKDLEKEIKDISLKLSRIFDIQGVCRIDFIYYENNLYVSEINLIPGALSHYLFKDKKEIYFDCLIKESFKYHRNRLDKIYSFSSNVLNLNNKLKK